MEYEEVSSRDLTELQKNILLQVRAIRRVNPTFPGARLYLAERLGRRRGQIQTALCRLHEELHLVGPLVLDPRDIQLTEHGEELADQLDSHGA